jgi:hypothetical protein
MHVEKVIETPEGKFTFKGELTAEEHDYVITVGLSYLFQAGALPFQVQEETPGNIQ